jgi:uncharacterized protein (TIGR02145 family)
MRRIFNTLAALILAVNILAQVPQLMSYQAVIRNGQGQLVANKQVGMKISILQTSISGTAVYTETQTPTTNVNGLVSIQIGGGIGFSSINWANGPYFIKTETDISGGTNYTITGTSQLLSVPYALAAGSLVINKDSKPFDTFMKDDGTVIGLPRIAVQQPFDSVPTVSDIDGNIYETVKIGNQVWMTSNLKTTHYRNGDAIPNVTDNVAWQNSITGARCTYNNTVNTDSINMFGQLYNFHAVADSRGIAPNGWHVATEKEWTALATYLGALASGRLKEAGTTHWKAPNIDGLNDSKFSALPSGYRPNSFAGLGESTNWWTCSSQSASSAYIKSLAFVNSDFVNSNLSKKMGLSVRCIKGNYPSIPSSIFIKLDSTTFHSTSPITGSITTTSNLKSVTLYRDGSIVSGWPKTTFGIGQPIAGTSANGTFIIKIDSLFSAANYTLKATDINDNDYNQNFTVEKQLIEIVLPVKIFCTLVDGTNNTTCSSKDGTTYAPKNATPSQQQIIDFVYFYGAVYAPSNVISALTSTFSNWIIKNATTFAKTTTIGYSTATYEQVKSIADAAIDKSIKALAINDVVIFKTAAGKVGVFKVNTITAGYSASDYIEISIKVQP